MRFSIPVVETADHGNHAGIRSPDAEHGAGLAIPREQVSPYGFVEAIVAALVEEVEILIGEQGRRIRDGDGNLRHFRFLVYRKMGKKTHRALCREWDAPRVRKDYRRFSPNAFSREFRASAKPNWRARLAFRPCPPCV